MSSSEKQLSSPIYPDLDVVNNEEKIAEENNLLSGDLERLNGKVPTVRYIHIYEKFKCYKFEFAIDRKTVNQNEHVCKNVKMIDKYLKNKIQIYCLSNSFEMI